MARSLSIVLGRHGQVADLRSGDVTVDGVKLNFIDIERMPDAYRQMICQTPYDICELAPTAYLMALSAGVPITALPIPMTRRFRHKGIMRATNSSVTVPKDLEGRSVGLRSYGVTATVWTRGILADEYGVDLDRVTWMVQEDEYLAAFVPPENVRKIPNGDTVASLLSEGRLDAAFDGLAGIGTHSCELSELIADASAHEANWFMRTGIYPLHGVIAIRNDVIAEDPGIGERLFAAFSAAKQHYWDRVRRGDSVAKEDIRYLKLADLVGDPLPYGLDENIRTFEALVRFAYRQGLIGRVPPVDILFPDPRLARGLKYACWS